jgi:hypothetical protein
MTHVLRPAFAGPVSALILACSVVACSGDSALGDSAVGTAGASAPINIVQSSMFLSVENQAGQPLVDIAISIQPVGGTMPYTTRVSRLESGGKKDLSFGDFAGRDGTRFNLRIARPRAITVTAADLVGKKYETTVPWK